MNVKSIERNGNQTTIVVEIDKDLMESGVNKAYLKARKNIMLPGFRKGKAPRKMIEAMYGAHVFYEDGLDEIFPQVYEEAVIKQEIKAVGRPSLTDMQISEDNLVTITIVTDVYPEVTLGDYKGIEVEKENAEVTDEQVDAEVDSARARLARTVEVTDRPAANGDIANIDFEGFVDGVAFEGGKGEGHDLKLGSGSFIPGFEAQIEGKNVGEEFDVNVTFPEDYHAAELAGKAAVFKTKLNSLKVEELPEADDDFAKDVSEFDTLDEYKADIRAKIAKRNEDAADREVETALMDALMEKLVAEIPEVMFVAETENFLRDYDNRLRMQGLDLGQYTKYTGLTLDALRAQFRPNAEKQVKTRLALEKIAELENLTVTDEEIEAEYTRISEAYNVPVDQVKSMVAVEDIKADMLVANAMKFVKDNAVIK